MLKSILYLLGKGIAALTFNKGFISQTFKLLHSLSDLDNYINISILIER